MSSKRILDRKTRSASRTGPRSSTRRRIHTQMKVLAVANNVTRQRPDCARNINETGIAALIPAQLRVGGAVTIELTFPRSGQTFFIQGVVRGIEKLQYAMERAG